MTARSLVAFAALVGVLGWMGWNLQASRRSQDRLAAKLEQLEATVAARVTADDSGQRIAAAAAVHLGTGAQQTEVIQGMARRLDELAANTAPAPVPPPTLPSTEQIAAAHAARALVERSIGQGRWTEETKHELASFMRVVDNDTRDELARAVIRAINAGKMTVDGPIM